MKKKHLLFLIVLSVFCAKGQDFQIPIEGEYGIDYIIVNYPDWHIEEGPILETDGFLKDYRCGSKTYDGHQGTDFVIRGFPQMDSGVNVLSVADGQVIHITDNLFDRETEGIEAYGLGNYVGIYHILTDTYSYYAHLKKNSVPLTVGDFVSAGEVIGEVGSSGNSTDPHLHFELWNPGVATDPTIDPWGLPCGEGVNLWADSPAYDTSFALWESGLVNYNSVENFNPLTWTPLKERFDPKLGFDLEDPFFTFWVLQYGLKIGDKTKIEWYEPNGNLYETEVVDYETQDWWFHYFNHSIASPSVEKQGVWNIKYYYNDSLYLTKSFVFGHLSNAFNYSKFFNCYYYLKDAKNLTVVLPQGHTYAEFTLFTLSGQLLFQDKTRGRTEINLAIREEMMKGSYYITFYNDFGRDILKVNLE